jgi:hypothetical protein
MGLDCRLGVRCRGFSCDLGWFGLVGPAFGVLEGLEGERFELGE